jgi:hypothetical protein
VDPYIGITDFTSFKQVEEMSQIFHDHIPRRSKRKLHVGVMMSYKTLHGIPSKWGNVFPAKESIANIFRSDNVYNCLHYADYDNNPELWRSLSEAISYGGIGIHAIQLDMVWPDPGEVANGVHTSRKHIEVILQVGSKAIEAANNDPAQVISRLEDYEGVIHRVLLDKSGGKGLGMDAAALLPFARAIRERFPKLGLVAAGGLGPVTMYLVEPLARQIPDLSIDAQGRLRPSGKAQDPINWTMAGMYLMRALRLLEK